ncbi:uncharacterized protein LOC141859496 [Acropora palmata]
MALTINYPAFHPAYFTRSGAKFKMADESFVLVDQLTEDFDLENELFDDKNDIMVFSAVTCFMRRDLNRIDGYFEVTVPTYEPNHFRMTRGTCEILCLEVMNTARIPAGNTRGRQLIPPTKQVLAFLWSMANQEPTRLVTDRFNITMSSVNRVLQIGAQALADLNAEYIKWPNGHRMNAIKAAFEEGGFLGVVCLIDGTHTSIRAPMEEPEAYINQKNSIQ